MRLTAQTLETPTVEISIHAPLTGCDLMPTYNLPVRCDFNPRTPYGMRRCYKVTYKESIQNFNPRTPYGMRRGARGNITRLIQISIHAPLTGCDLLAYAVTKTPHISIHAPLTGCDLISGVQKAFALLFQSTHPLRDATERFCLLKL